jgi:hypothetical protein
MKFSCQSISARVCVIAPSNTLAPLEVRRPSLRAGLGVAFSAVNQIASLSIPFPLRLQPFLELSGLAA